MENAVNKLKALISHGEQFSYVNFSTKSEHGNTKFFTPQWVSWSAQVSGSIEKLFEPDSAPAKTIKLAQQVTLIGNGKDKFELARAYYMGSLEAALEIIQDDTFGQSSLERADAIAPRNFSNKVFVVHGRDDHSKQELEILISEMGLEPIVLHRQADIGRVLIEKFEHYADVGYAFILMTPDEIAYLNAEEGKPDAERIKEHRARPNVIFEFGFFVGRIGRSRTCCLLKGDVAVPSDLAGLVYKRFDRSIEEVAWAIQRDLRAVGYKLK